MEALFTYFAVTINRTGQWMMVSAKVASTEREQNSAELAVLLSERRCSDQAQVIDEVAEDNLDSTSMDLTLQAAAFQLEFAVAVRIIESRIDKLQNWISRNKKQ
jgi:hypothetical protein